MRWVSGCIRSRLSIHDPMMHYENYNFDKLKKLILNNARESIQKSVSRV